MHLLDVGDDPDPSALGLEAVEGVHGQRQRLGVEAAEAFVDEQRLDGQLPRGQRGEPERHGQRHQKGLAAG